MRSVLVCVRTPAGAQTIAMSAARLGMGSQVRTALTAGEALAQLAVDPADLILADTALSRPDSADFTRQVLATAPGAVLVLFGPEDPRVAAAAVAAGARGVIRGDPADPVTVVTKALLIVFGPRAGRDRETVARAAVSGKAGNAGSRGAVARTSTPGRAAPGGDAYPLGAPPAVPQQRDAVPGAPDTPEVPRRRVDLTERELQVLRGMADGKSNAEIGRDLYVSEDTVKTHARRLFRKLGARDRAHAVASAFRAGLVS